MNGDDATGLMSDRVQATFERLRREYLDEMPERLAALEGAARARDAEALRIGLHQLAGSGGSHGFPAISTTARELERVLAAGGSPERIEEGLASLRAAVVDAREELR